MNKKVTNLFKTIRSVSSKHSPEILTGIGIAGMITTTILAVKATPKALQLIAEAEDKKFDNGHGEALTKVEVVKTAWKPYIPAAVTGVTSAMCLIGASKVSLKRNAALATAYKLSETAFAEYKEKVVETIGEKKEKVVKEKIAKEKVQNNPVSSREVIITGKGDTLCFDTLSGQYFKSDIDRIKRIENELNKRMMSEMYISLNEFYSEVGLRRTKLGDMMGWNLDKGLIELDFSSQLTDEGTPCLVIDYMVAPRYDYDKLM